MAESEYIDKIHYGFHEAPFAKCLIAIADNSLCYLAFVDDSEEQALARLTKTWPKTQLLEDKSQSEIFLQKIFYSDNKKEFEVMLNGTDFEIAVWNALCTIPLGTTVSYQQVADALGKKKAVRAVASAIGRNHIAYIIPCHRVVRKSGDLGGYAFGLEIKKDLIDYERKKLVRS